MFVFMFVKWWVGDGFYVMCVIVLGFGLCGFGYF